jgi:type IV pilus assembly protein PilB
VDYARERLGELLVSAGSIDRAQLTEALAIQAREGGKLGEVLVRSLVLTEEQIADALGRQKGLEHISLISYPIERAATALVPERMAKRRDIIPVSFDGEVLVLAMADPLDIESIDDVEMLTGHRVRPVVAAVSQVRNAIEKFIVSSDVFQDVVDSMDEAVEEPELADSDNVPVVRLVNQVVREGVRDGASDIHIEPGLKTVAVRYRVDGVLREVMVLPVAARAGVLSRIKIMADMDISERRRPQDGRIALKVDDRPVDIRVASLPTPFGEALTLRILNSELSFHAISELGLSHDNLRSLERMLQRPYGAILISGPTGSGKSTSMYAMLHEISDVTRKTITIEDPIEYQMAGITQMAVNARIGLTFASGLRTILRSDPDIVMVGEVRDPETAEIAVRASLTGHLVLSSIHTNDAPSALTRLNDMGVPPYITSSAVIGIVAQRLVRVLCPHCKELLKVSGSRLVAAGFTATEAKSVKVHGPIGCDQCGGTGYRGRLGVFELMELDDEIVRAFLDHAPAERLRELALAAGMVPMRRDALDKVAAGITSLEEIDRVVL